MITVLIIALVAAVFLLLRAFLSLQSEHARLQGLYILRGQQRMDALAEATNERIRARDLARENNRLLQQLRQRPSLPQGLRDALDYADSRNSPRLDVSSIGKCICIPVSTWNSIMTKANFDVPTKREGTSRA